MPSLLPSVLKRIPSFFVLLSVSFFFVGSVCAENIESLEHSGNSVAVTAKQNKEQNKEQKGEESQDKEEGQNKTDVEKKPLGDESSKVETEKKEHKEEKKNTEIRNETKPNKKTKADKLKKHGDKKSGKENKSDSDKTKTDSKELKSKKAGINTETESKKTEPEKEVPKKEEPKPDTLELKKEPLRLTSKVTGTFESKRAENVRLKGEVFTTFELLEVVQHGAEIRRGDVLIKFDPKKYEEALQERKRTLRLSEIALKEEEISFKYLEKRRSLQKEALERNKKHEEEDFVYFFNVEQDMMKKMFDFTVKVYQFYLDSAKEELRQLEKMYENDDLIEETEEFILKRSKFMVEAQEFMLERNKEQADHTKNVLLGRMVESMQQGVKMNRYDYEMSKETFDFVFEQARLKLEKTKETHAKLLEQHEKFLKDRQMLTLKSPCDGIVYYGEYNGKLSPGKWNGASTVAGGMKIGESIANKTVLFTIVDPKPKQIRATIAEKELHWIKVGTRGTVAPTAFPDVRYDVRVTERDSCPTAANNFVALLSVNLPEDGKIFPAMTGSVELVVYDKKETILVPTAAIKREEIEDDSWNHAYLYVYRKNKIVEKIKIKTGQVKGEKTEVLSGVRSGDHVFKTFPGGEKWIEDEKERKKKEKQQKKEAEKKAKVIDVQDKNRNG